MLVVRLDYFHFYVVATLKLCEHHISLFAKHHAELVECDENARVHHLVLECLIATEI